MTKTPEWHDFSEICFGCRDGICLEHPRPGETEEQFKHRKDRQLNAWVRYDWEPLLQRLCDACAQAAAVLPEDAPERRTLARYAEVARQSLDAFPMPDSSATLNEWARTMRISTLARQAENRLTLYAARRAVESQPALLDSPSELAAHIFNWMGPLSEAIGDLGVVTEAFRRTLIELSVASEGHHSVE